MTVRVRRFRDGDARKASDMIRKTQREVNSRYYSRSVIERLCKTMTPGKMKEYSEERIFYVAVDGEKIVGTVTLAEDNHIGTLFVHPRYHNMGVGRKLMEKIEEVARKRGVKRMRLSAAVNAVGFYKRIGYKHPRKFKDKCCSTVYKMSKKL
ncbi:MAG: GNAT family N-acetyltransferase [Candidatus Altiarchaeales archaeon]|nr:GNAT family N-acetyltransferase [Candidatus Altiarchaeales archaeon]MBD3416687.1 GNAT family N-acetyltransferase [Candidatus Altiarchaeales archaeon]